MQVLAPDVFADLLGLPAAALIVMLLAGALLALTGWRWHRFWLTIIVSLISGLIGLRQAPAWGIGQPVVAGALMAAAAGCLALSLARVGLFLAYGLGTWYVMKRFAPEVAIPAVCIAAGGLFSVLFYRFCVVLLTSAAGCVLLCYGALGLAEQQSWFPTKMWLQEHTLIVNAAWAGIALMMLMLQLYFWRAAQQKLKRAKTEFTEAELEAERRMGFPTRRYAA
jgi:hypothetical protein